MPKRSLIFAAKGLVTSRSRELGDPPARIRVQGAPVSETIVADRDDRS